MRAHLVGDADDHFEVRADAGAVAAFRDELQVAVVVGDGAGLLVEVGGGQDDVGEDGGFGHEHVLHHEERVLEGGRVDAVAEDRVRADDVQGRELAGCGGVEHFEQVETLRRRAPCISAKAGEPSAV